MTAPNDADRLVHAFLQDGPAELSPPLHERIRDEVHDTRQRTARRPWRTPSMPRTLLLVASLAAVIVAFGAMLLVGSGGRTSVPTPAPTAAALVTPSVAPTPSPSPSISPGPSPYPLADGEAWIVLEGPDSTRHAHPARRHRTARHPDGARGGRAQPRMVAGRQAAGLRRERRPRYAALGRRCRRHRRAPADADAHGLSERHVHRGRAPGVVAGRPHDRLHRASSTTTAS